MNLASVEKITDIQPIPDADAIEVASLLGWQIVVKKDEFRVGDLVGYIQIDTVVPQTDQFEFLRPRGFRVRTIKLRKQISQGLIVPLPETCNSSVRWKEGDDLTEILGVKKFTKDNELIEDVPQVPKTFWKRLVYKIKYKYLHKWFPSMKSYSKAAFPSHLVPKTDEERIQNIPRVLETHKGKAFISSEKLDGSSITIIHERKGYWMGGDHTFRICSRNWEYLKDGNDYHKVFKSTNFGNHILKLVDFFNTDNIIVQGEYIGKPQGNKYKLTENKIMLFNIFVDGKRIDQSRFYDICGGLEIPACPRLDRFIFDFDLPSIIKYAEGKSQLHTSVEREGVVFRCVEDNLSFKAISNKFLLKNDE